MKTIAVITGAAGGIGREFVKTLPQHGSFKELWVISRNAEKLQALRKESKIPVKVFSLDLTDPASFERIQALYKKEKPEIRLLINASGYGKFDAVEDTDMETELNMIDLNCRALSAMTRLSLPYMHEGAGIIQVASVAAFQPIPYMDVYGATKAFVLSYARALNRELQKRGIHVMALCPFWTKTAFFQRAVDESKPPVVKKYIAMYEPAFIVKKAWKAFEKKKDLVIPGFKAKAQVFLVKLLPHSLVMSVWMKQQKL